MRTTFMSLLSATAIAAGALSGFASADTPTVGDSFAYVTANQLEKSAALNGGIDAGSGTYDLVRVKALTEGTTGH